MMRAPDAEELAAIAAAYVAVSRDDAPAAAHPSRWRLAARLPAADRGRPGFAARSASRWKLAGRMHG
jgi:hypothetical protein